MSSVSPRIAGPVLLAVLLVASGCGHLAGPGQGTDTLTPVPDTPTPSSNTIPGVTGDEVVDGVALADAHRSRLSNRSFTVVERVVVRNARDVTHRSMVRIQWAGGGTERYRSRSRFDPFPGCSGNTTTATFRRYATQDVVYSNGTVCGRERTRQFDGSGPERFDPRQYLPFGPTRHEFLLATLPTAPDGGWAVEPMPNGTYRLSAPLTGYATQGYPFRGAESRGEDVATENTSVTLTVTDDGLVRSYRLRYTVIVDGKEYTVLRRGHFDAVGATTVERPAWAPDTATRTPTGAGV